MAEVKNEMTFTIDGINVKVITSNFHPKDETPKSYGKPIVNMFRPHSDTETGLVKIYKLNDGTYRASTYVDGCFHAQYAKIEFVDDTLDRFINARNEYYSSEKRGSEVKKAIFSKYNLI